MFNVQVIVLPLALACFMAAFYLLATKEDVPDWAYKSLFISVIFVVVVAILSMSGVITQEGVLSLFGMYQEVAK